MPRDADATRARILEAAAYEFTGRGLAGARVDEIARRAQANKQLIYCHFGSKERLFTAVLEDRLSRIMEATHLEPSRVVEAAGELFDFYAANPDVVRLIEWEALAFGAGPVPGEEGRRERLQAVVGVLEEAQRHGTVDTALDPRQLLAHLMGLIMWWFAAPQAARMLSGGDPYTPRALAARRAAVVDAVRRIVEAP